jgi:hypothetical protein
MYSTIKKKLLKKERSTMKNMKNIIDRNDKNTGINNVFHLNVLVVHRQL